MNFSVPCLLCLESPPQKEMLPLPPGAMNSQVMMCSRFISVHEIKHPDKNHLTGEGACFPYSFRLYGPSEKSRLQELKVARRRVHRGEPVPP